MYRVASFSVGNFIGEILFVKSGAFDLGVFSAGLEWYVNDVRNILRQVTEAEADTYTILNPYQQREFILRRASELGIPETSVPWWVREMQWLNLQGYHILSLEDMLGGLILSGSTDPAWPGNAILRPNIQVTPERARGGDVLSRGSYTVDVFSRDKGIRETITVPVNQYYEKVYPNAILDLDSVVNAFDAIQWLFHALFWHDLPTLLPDREARNVQFSGAPHSLNPVHLIFDNRGDRAWSLEIKTVTDTSMPMDLVLRNPANFTDKIADARLSLERGSQVFVIRGSYAGLPAPLPSLQMSFYPRERATVKIERITPLDFWESLARGYLF